MLPFPTLWICNLIEKKPVPRFLIGRQMGIFGFTLTWEEAQLDAPQMAARGSYRKWSALDLILMEDTGLVPLVLTMMFNH